MHAKMMSPSNTAYSTAVAASLDRKKRQIVDMELTLSALIGKPRASRGLLKG
jgi:hypothetical protein